jgi:hypothetical protein
VKCKHCRAHRLLRCARRDAAAQVSWLTQSLERRIAGFQPRQLCAFDIEIMDWAALFHGEAPDACGIRLPAHASCPFPPLAFWSWDFVRGRACFHKGFRRPRSTRPRSVRSPEGNIAAAALWFVTIYGVLAVLTVKSDKPSLADGFNGGSLISAVASQAVAMLTAAGKMGRAASSAVGI